MLCLTEEGKIMGHMLHARARTTPAVRREIQNSKESLIRLAARYGVNPKTVEKWRKRDFIHDAPMGPKVIRSRSLSQIEEAAIVAFRVFTQLPLDDCLYSLQDSMPHLTRSSLHRCLQRHGLSKLPDEKTQDNEKKKFKTYPIGYFHVDIAEVQTEEGRLYLFTAIDRTSKFAYAELHDEATRATAKSFLEHLIAAAPYTIHTILTDNGIQFTNRQRDIMAFMTPFDRVCHRHGIEHRLTKVKHPWTNGQVERMNRTIKEATVGRYHYGSHKELKEHLHAFLMAYNLANRLKTLKGKSPYDFIRNIWTLEPERFTSNPNHFNVGLNT
jgi:transposase InsO family protein